MEPVGTPFSDATTGGDLQIVLRHVADPAKEEWYLERKIRYRDENFAQPIIVPRNTDTFTTDLTSVPQLLTWLVPRTGSHLAAALVHDALTPPFSVEGVPDWEGPEQISQVQADQVFRNAMRDLGTPTLRRWLVWAAVSVPTAFRVSLLGKVAVVAMFLAIAVLGWLATVDLFDQGSWLFWMGEHSWPWELAGGLAGAVVVPLAISLVWPKGVRSAGAIVGVALAALLHVTLAVGVVTWLYQVLEHRWRAWGGPQALWKVVGTVLAVAATVFSWWWCRHY